ncbi:translational GTPase TypA [Pseudodesulfovibrio sp. zrk46]|uniref:translational GTPase TypA n=1 Tax=Pseudodesulfovibrio sp. zrk46 TaxID=2725288 RepID=UPI0014491A84|nr:translational GTPase TypA [Pseudodesulfovibrio sp. zrk46]QJB55059.1 translational GTPase TypA [Pseudodesulfovibrio sp. zrk46]
MITNDKLRNIAIIAHVDHGKTTLVDAMFKQSGLFREGQEVDDRIMDSMDLERERGITIAAKNCSVSWKDVKINIIDTPGHADFGGEVERSLSMADGAILLVDASEGPLPQTRFVLKKALEQGLALMVVINKVDRQDARPEEVLNEVYDLFIDLDANEEQLDFPLLYAIGRDGIAMETPEERGENLHILLDMVLENVPGPSYDENEPFQMLVSDLSYSDYLGRLAIGKVHHGSSKSNDQLLCLADEGKEVPLKVTKLQTYDGLKVVPTETCEPGDIIVIAGIEDVKIGDTICTKEAPKALPRITVDEPTVSMRFGINTSPLAGKEGEHVQSNKIRERLMRETLLNVAIQVEDTDGKDAFLVKGRGELQMAILVEQMRREGFELSVGRPEVIIKEQDGKKLEPIEHLFVDCDEEFMGIVTEKIQTRKGRMSNMVNHGTGRVRLEFSVPSRALIGYRDEFLTDTKGTGIMNSYLEGYGEHRGEFTSRYTGSLVADRAGKGVAYGIFNLEPRGRMFIVPGDAIYEGMIVGEHNRDNDININPSKEKKLTNMRASGKDEAVILTPVKPMTLEYALNFIKDDELVEVTPQSIRLRKIELSALVRHREEGRKKKAKEAKGK